MITPHQLAAEGSESAHQKAMFQWVACSGAKRYPDMIRAYAVPNGSKLIGSGTARGRSEGAKMKAEGLRAGVPDVHVPVACIKPQHCDGYHSLYIELKRPGREKDKDGGRSDEQVEWHRALIGLGHAVVTAYGWMPGADALSLYFSGSLVMPDDGDCLFLVGTGREPW